MSRSLTRCLLVAGFAPTTLLALAPAASAAEVLVIPIDGFYRGEPGTRTLVASVAVPAELVGQSCDVGGETDNQLSVHPGNNLVVMSGPQSFVIPDFEDEGYIVHHAGAAEILADTIDVSIEFGPDGVSSGGFKVTIDNCSEPAPQITPPGTTVAPKPPLGPVVPAPDQVVPSTATPTTATPTTATSTTARSAATEAAKPSLPVTGTATVVLLVSGLILGLGGLALVTASRRWSPV